MERQLPIIKLRKLWYLFSGVLFIASVAVLALWGLRFGIDFTGGSLLEVEYKEARPELPQIKESTSALDIGEVLLQLSSENGVLLRFPAVDELKHQEILDKLRSHGELDERRFTSIGPTIGTELTRKAGIALGSATLGIMLYIAWAFRRVSKPVPSWQYGLTTALVALFHDSLIPLGVFAALGKWQQWEVGIPFVAAMLTVLGFSVHDTIVVFDRTRENLKKASGAEQFADVVNKSVNQTIGRSITTSSTVLFTVAAIYFFGGETLKPFALVLFVGLAAGTYSSIFIASPLLVDFQRIKFRLPRIRRHR